MAHTDQIIDLIDEGIIAVDSRGYITTYNKIARDFFGINLTDGPGHRDGKCVEGDWVLIADNGLGEDDGGMKAQDFKVIGVDPVDIMEGDSIVAIGRKGGLLGEGIYKRLEKHTAQKELFVETYINGIKLRSMINYDLKLLRITVGEQNFDYIYLWSAGHMVIVDGKNMQVKFYQSRGYTARNEDMKTILYGGHFMGKGIYGKSIDVEHMHISELHPDSDIIKKLTDVALGEDCSIRGMETSINGIPVRCSIKPLNKDGKRVGALLKLTDITEIKVLWQEREKALLTLETLENKLKTFHIKEEAFKDIVGNSESIKYAVDLAKRAADTSSTVLLLGESGTGKGVFAEAIHRASSRRDKPFVYVNCASIPEALIESELFGHERGAFTGAVSEKKGKFEMADGGSIFLDEIVELPLTLQAKLLHVMHSKSFTRVGGVRPIKVDIRIITATNKDLESMVAKGEFRDDLFYRINVICIKIPPLRERKEDIYLLTKYLLPRLREQTGKACTEISEDVMNIFFRYDWPGNVRELENVLERSCIMADGPVILPSHLPEYLKKSSFAPASGRVEIKRLGPLKDLVQEIEIQAIKQALRISGGNKTQAMNLLGMKKTNFYKKLKLVRNNEHKGSQ
jgi:transcriptional regulator with PAS, ATPase and Fis domain